MPKLTDKQLSDLIAKSTEEVLKSKGLDKALRKIKFNDKPIDEMSKEEKTIRYFQAKIEQNRADIIKYSGGYQKDLTGGTAGAGQELIPTEFHADIIDRVVSDPRALRNLTTVIPVTFRNGNWPIGSTGVNLNWETSETNPITGTQPQFGSLNYSVSRLDGLTAISRDLLADTPINLYSYLVKQYSKAFVKAENIAIISGTGVNQPTGIINTAGIKTTAIANAATTNVLTADDMIALPYSVDISWRDGGAYFMNTSAVRQAKLLKDNQGRYLWTNGDVQTGTPANFNGYPVYEFTAIFPENLTVNSKSTCSELLFGNLEYYYLFDKEEMGMEVNTQSDQAFKNHEVILKFWQREDGKVAVPTAFALLTGFLK